MQQSGSLGLWLLFALFIMHAASKTYKVETIEQNDLKYTLKRIGFDLDQIKKSAKRVKKTYGKAKEGIKAKLSVLMADEKKSVDEAKVKMVALQAREKTLPSQYQKKLKKLTKNDNEQIKSVEQFIDQFLKEHPVKNIFPKFTAPSLKVEIKTKEGKKEAKDEAKNEAKDEVKEGTKDEVQKGAKDEVKEDEGKPKQHKKKNKAKESQE